MMEIDGERDANATQYLKQANAEARNGFVRKVYSILAFQLLVTTVVAAPFQHLSPSWLHHNMWALYLSYAGVFITLICAMCSKSALREFPSNYVVLGLVSVFMGVMCGLLVSLYTAQSVFLAMGVTIVVFLALTAYACTTKTDFTGCGPYLFGFLSILCCFGFALMVLSMCGVHIRFLEVCYNLFGIVLFTFYIIFDTQKILGGDRAETLSVDDYAVGALELYLDIINMFLYILSLLGDKK